MPRHHRLFLPGAIYHVSCRVARGEFVFDDDFESIEALRTVRDLDAWTIFVWSVKIPSSRNGSTPSMLRSHVKTEKPEL